MPLKKTESSRDLTLPVNYKHKRFEVTARTGERLNKGINDGELTIQSPEDKDFARYKHDQENYDHNKKKGKIPLSKEPASEDTYHNTNTTPDQRDPKVGYHLSGEKSNVSYPNPPPGYGAVDVNESRYGDYTNLATRFGGKSKRIKSKTKSCCSVRKSAKVCRRKTDNKKFRLPRRFSRKTCLAKKPRGFTMRSSCAPYKGCKKTRKGGMMGNTELTDEEILEELKKYPSAYKKLIDDMFEGTNELSEEEAVNLRKQVEQKAINTIKSVTNSLREMPEPQRSQLLRSLFNIEENYRTRSGGYKKSSYKTRKNKNKRQ